MIFPPWTWTVQNSTRQDVSMYAQLNRRRSYKAPTDRRHEHSMEQNQCCRELTSLSCKEMRIDHYTAAHQYSSAIGSRILYHTAILWPYHQHILPPMTTQNQVPGTYYNTSKYFKTRIIRYYCCLLYTSPSPRDLSTSRMPSSA